MPPLRLPLLLKRQANNLRLFASKKTDFAKIPSFLYRIAAFTAIYRVLAREYIEYDFKTNHTYRQKLSWTHHLRELRYDVSNVFYLNGVIDRAEYNPIYIVHIDIVDRYQLQ